MLLNFVDLLCLVFIAMNYSGVITMRNLVQVAVLSVDFYWYKLPMCCQIFFCAGKFIWLPVKSTLSVTNGLWFTLLVIYVWGKHALLFRASMYISTFLFLAKNKQCCYHVTIPDLHFFISFIF